MISLLNSKLFSSLLPTHFQIRCSIPRIIGRLYFELRKDLVPVASANFLSLVKGSYGVSHKDSVRYHYLGTKIHRVVKNKLFQAGDVLGSDSIQYKLLRIILFGLT